jgi:hypothetical protein
MPQSCKPSGKRLASAFAALDRGEFKEFQNIERMASLFERPLREGHFPNGQIGASWSSGNGAFASALRQSSISQQ